MIAVVWIDWYAYHHARLRALTEHPSLAGRVAGIELVGKTGVHKGLVFRESAAKELPLITLMPEESWSRETQLRLLPLLWRKLSELNPDTVLVPGYYTLPGLCTAIWAKFHRRRSVLMTESTQFDHARSAWKEALKSRLLRVLFDSAVAGGKAHVRYLDALGFPMDEVRDCYDVVDNEAFAAGAEQARVIGGRPAGAPSKPYFLYVGRLAPEKSVGSLIEAWSAYRWRGGDWPLVIVGGGAEEADLRVAAQASGFGEDVHFAGMKSSRELPPWYAWAGCFVLPSTLEPWGLVTNEAMACGLPVIVSDRCGCAEDLVQDGRNGFTFRSGDVEELSRRLDAVAAMPAAERAAMQAESRRIVARHSLSRWAQQVADLGRAAGPARREQALEAVS